MPDAVPGVVTITVPPLTGGVGVITTPDYGPQLVLITESMAALATSIGATATAVTEMNAQLLILRNYLYAVQSATGDFRTVSPEDVASTAMVEAALAKNVPPIVPTPGTTS